jgi:hypothetical protein
MAPKRRERLPNPHEFNPAGSNGTFRLKYCSLGFLEKALHRLYKEWNFCYTIKCEESNMVAVKAYYDGRAFIPEIPVKADINQPAIITILDNQIPDAAKKGRLLSLAGSISHDDYLAIEKTLEDTERVYPNEW